MILTENVVLGRREKTCCLDDMEESESIPFGGFKNKTKIISWFRNVSPLCYFLHLFHVIYWYLYYHHTLAMVQESLTLDGI